MILGIDYKPLILICGPTGVGKSDIAVKLAKEINGEVISADSVQVYKGLNIGSAKITLEEMEGVPHYLIDILNPDEDYGVHLFQKHARQAINQIYSNGHIPVIVGGTAFYIQALLYNIDFTEESSSDHSYRDELLVKASTDEDRVRLWNHLNTLDPEYAQKTHYNNIKRVVRALEYMHNTGRKFSEYNAEQSSKKSEYDFYYFGLTDDRNALYERINRRVDNMINAGLIDEVKTLMENGYNCNLNSMSSIGYKEICLYLNGTITLDNAIDSIKQNSRHYAKRQLTWLRREQDVIFIDRSNYLSDKEIISFIIETGKLWDYMKN